MDRWISILPLLVALAIALFSKSSVFALLIGVIIGVVLLGENVLTGFSKVGISALADENFIWVLLIQVFLSIMVAFFQKMGAVDIFSNAVSRKNIKRRGAQVFAWFLGILIFFSEHLSALYVGTVMRGITDKARISREKLAYIIDSTSAPVCTIVPFSNWGVYMASLLVGTGLFVGKTEAMGAIFRMIPYNFYGIISVFFVGLIAIGIIPDFGPMKKAEQRAIETGAVYAVGSNPLIGKEMKDIVPQVIVRPNVILHFIVPLLIVALITIISFATIGEILILEAFIATVFYQFAIMYLQKMCTLKEILDTAMAGVKSIVNAILVTALAYCLNYITGHLGVKEFIMETTKPWLSPSYLWAATFLTGFVVSFFTGTSWGNYAILVPIMVPIAIGLSGGNETTLVYGTIAAIMGGVSFGEHCSPISDSTILASLSAGSDHIDHVKTQLPYAITVGVIALILYLVIGILYGKIA
ncbi:MAG: transporter [Tissierellia bacterium]|nr:transporter [Tissierellia bacterium]